MLIPGLKEKGSLKASHYRGAFLDIHCFRVPKVSVLMEGQRYMGCMWTNAAKRGYRDMGQVAWICPSPLLLKFLRT